MKCLRCRSTRIEVPAAPEPDTYAMILHPEGDSTDLHKPWCRDCGSNDIKAENEERKRNDPN